MKKYFLFLLLLLWHPLLEAAPPKVEIRAVWLTTIYGLDWPSKPANSAVEIKQQQDELIAILDKLKEANFNTIFIQSRLRGDVIYRSVVEPAAKVFSGKYGRLPGYDPLQFVIDECHKRGMECHAWLVTFPVGKDNIVKEQGNRSVVKRYPKLVKFHRGEWYLDPGVPETTDYLVTLVKELVTAYDIDGIHFDYIRYPEQATSFPDKQLFKKQGKGQSIDEWRRENINRLVSTLYDEVKKHKLWVQVSSSPLGKYNRIERVPNASWTAYETVFQDPKQWMQEGKHDMIVPMMYYLHDNFFPFVDNWAENCNGRLIVPGLGAYRTEQNEADWALNDITDQMDYSRHFGGAGCTFFRCKHVLDNPKGLFKELKDNYYAHPALLPPLTWLNEQVPPTPQEVQVEKNENNTLRIYWDNPCENDSITYTLYYSLTDTIDTSSSQHILATGLHENEYILRLPPETDQGYLFAVSSSTRYHIESPASKKIYYYATAYQK